MSRRRYTPRARLAFGPTGRALCRWCQTEVSPPRRTFCSDACVHEHSMRTSSTYVRRVLFERDHGRCALCGVDTADALRELQALRRAMLGGRPGTVTAARDAYLAAFARLGIPMARFDGVRYPELWDADHIVPVVEGGGECDLANYRTLCIPCHQRETAALATRRAQQRRDAAEPPADPSPSA
jgi:5-methylcytosine-specific restriction protein A